MSERWPPPTDPAAFESLCADLWGSIWGHVAQKNGRSGQPQAGVDVYGKHGNEWIGIQCKKKDELLRSALTPKELAQEVEAARGFVPPLKRFIIATTGAADAKLQEVARNLTVEHAQQGLFEVELWGWPEIWAELSRRPALLQVVAPIYWPRIVFVATEQGRQEQTAQILQAIHAPLLPCGIFFTLKFQVTDEVLERVYGDQVGFRRLPSPPIPVDGRHHFPGCYIDVQNNTVEAAGFFQSEYPGYNVFHQTVQHTIARFDPERCKRPLSGNEPLFMEPSVTLEFYRGGQQSSGDNQRPTIVLKTGSKFANRSVNLIASCAIDSTVLVDHEFPELSIEPPDASGFSVTSLRGSFIRVTLDFFFIKSVAWLPEQSWPCLHNLQLLLGSRRQALTFTLDDLSNQLTRSNPRPIAGGDVVMPQIVFECEIDSEKFERNLKALVGKPSPLQMSS